MAQVYRILVMDLNQFPGFVVHLLIKPDGNFSGIYLLHIPDFPP